MLKPSGQTGVEALALEPFGLGLKLLALASKFNSI